MLEHTRRLRAARACLRLVVMFYIKGLEVTIFKLTVDLITVMAALSPMNLLRRWRP